MALFEAFSSGNFLMQYKRWLLKEIKGIATVSRIFLLNTTETTQYGTCP